MPEALDLCTAEERQEVVSEGPLATVVRGEVEHRAGCGASPENKIGPYRTLFDNEAWVPVVLVVLTVEVAKRTSRVALDLPVMLTTLDELAARGFTMSWGIGPLLVINPKN